MAVINNNIIRDASLNSFPILKHGNIKQYGVSPFSVENRSVYFPKNSTPLNVKLSDTLNFRGNDFTVETWINIEQLNNIDFTSGDTTGFCVFSTTDAQSPLTLTVKSLPGNNFISKQTKITLTYGNITLAEGVLPDIYLQKWLHVAVSRRSGVYFLIHVNGEFITENILSVDIVNNNNSFIIGGVSTNNTGPLTKPANFVGYMTNFRVSNICRYGTNNFNVQQSAFIIDINTTFLALKNYNFVDDVNFDKNNKNVIDLGLQTSSNTIIPKIVSYTPFQSTRSYNPSYYSGSILHDSSALQVDMTSITFNISESWTYSSWIKNTNLTNNTSQTLFRINGSTSYLVFDLFGTNQFSQNFLRITYEILGQPNVVRYFPLQGYNVHEDGWFNIHVIHKNFINDHGSGVYTPGDKTLAVYINGKPLYVPNTDFDLQTDYIQEVYIGMNIDNSFQPKDYFKGFTSNTSFYADARIGNTLVDPSYNLLTTFLPEQALTTLPSLTFLLLFSDLELNDLTGTTLITPHGLLASDSFITKTDTPTYSFNGTDAFITVKPTTINNNFNFLTDFSIETWFIYNSVQVNNNPGIFHLSDSTTGPGLNYTTSITVGVNDSSKQIFVKILLNDGQMLAVSPQDSFVVPDKWHHISLVRHSGQFKFFMNGIEKIFLPQTYNNVLNNTMLAIGCGEDTVNTLFTGNIAGFRVTNNKTLYTSSFVPPTTLRV